MPTDSVVRTARRNSVQWCACLDCTQHAEHTPQPHLVQLVPMGLMPGETEPSEWITLPLCRACSEA